ncbi:hypothetical protein BROUX41_000494 [Berkeleyomyces rouxiae]
MNHSSLVIDLTTDELVVDVQSFDFITLSASASGGKRLLDKTGRTSAERPGAHAASQFAVDGWQEGHNREAQHRDAHPHAHTHNHNHSHSHSQTHPHPHPHPSHKAAGPQQPPRHLPSELHPSRAISRSRSRSHQRRFGVDGRDRPSLPSENFYTNDASPRPYKRIRPDLDFDWGLIPQSFYGTQDAAASSNHGRDSSSSARKNTLNPRQRLGNSSLPHSPADRVLVHGSDTKDFTLVPTSSVDSCLATNSIHAPKPERNTPPIRTLVPSPSRVRDLRRKPPEQPNDTDRVVPTQPTWHHQGPWPYLSRSNRDTVLETLSTDVPITELETLPSKTKFHVDFTPEEVDFLLEEGRKLVKFKKPPLDKIKELCRIIHKRPSSILHLSGLEREGRLARRSYMDIYNFLSDVNCRQTQRGIPAALWIDRDQTNGACNRSAKLASLRFSREIEGRQSFGKSRRYMNVKNDISCLLEDDLDVRQEWTNCAGDIATISWLSTDTFICGTTTHSDSHNQQYNRPGNLLIGSVKNRTLRGLPDHRIPRPIVDKGENSTNAMRESQDPWLYSSVVSSAFDEPTGLAYTSSFDHTVKIWRTDSQGDAIEHVATWQHTGNVNFVLPRGSFVATGMDVSDQAVRVYTIDPDGDISKSTYRSFGDRFGAINISIPGQEEGTPTWGYFPATMQWGKGIYCQYHLLVGYSPRSMSGDENDIPQNRRNSGVMRIWDVMTGYEVTLNCLLAQNVFEVAWHPTQQAFAVATSASSSMTNAESRIKTQVRIWSYTPDPLNIGTGSYHLKQTLDCYSADINEITIRPNSHSYSYVTAATTDGRVYVWDTSVGDAPIHILHHGRSVEPLLDTNEFDTGVRFMLWGSTPDRLYSGGSDGVLRVWNIRSKKPFVRNLIEVPGPLMAGAFSVDYSRMVIGDASGRVFLLTTDVSDSRPSDFLTLPMPGGKTRRIRRPQPFKPHPEPPPPIIGATSNPPSTMEGILHARDMLDSRQIVIYSNPTIGAVQGPNYAELGLYRAEAHSNGNTALQLTPEFASKQQENLHPAPKRMSSRKSVVFGSMKELVREDRYLVASLEEMRLHSLNRSRDLDLARMDRDTLRALRAERAQLELDHDFEYEVTPGYEDDKEASDRRAKLRRRASRRRRMVLDDEDLSMI